MEIWCNGTPENGEFPKIRKGVGHGLFSCNFHEKVLSWQVVAHSYILNDLYWFVRSRSKELLKLRSIARTKRRAESGKNGMNNTVRAPPYHGLATWRRIAIKQSTPMARSENSNRGSCSSSSNSTDGSKNLQPPLNINLNFRVQAHTT